MSEPRGPHPEEHPDNPRASGVWTIAWALVALVALATTVVLILYLDVLEWEDLARERAPRILLALALIAFIVSSIRIGASFRWTGFGDKTLYDWLDLLIVPLMLAFLTFALTQQQSDLQRKYDMQQQAIADRRADLTALQAYLDQMSSLLLDRKLGTCEVGPVVRDLARARTLTIMDTLSPIRKPRALEYLFEMDLIQVSYCEGVPSPNLEEREPIVSLKFADLHEADMHKRHLLRDADLEHANLNRANLVAARLNYAQLRKARLFRTKLCGAHLFGTDLTGAYLINANLKGAKLTQADLSKVDFSDANLNKVDGLTLEQVNQARSFQGATMPNGQKYGAWVKGDKSLQGDGNDNPSHCPILDPRRSD